MYGTLNYAVVTCETKHWNYFKIISAAKIISK